MSAPKMRLVKSSLNVREMSLKKNLPEDRTAASLEQAGR